MNRYLKVVIVEEEHAKLGERADFRGDRPQPIVEDPALGFRVCSLPRLRYKPALAAPIKAFDFPLVACRFSRVGWALWHSSRRAPLQTLIGVSSYINACRSPRGWSEADCRTPFIRVQGVLSFLQASFGGPASRYWSY